MTKRRVCGPTERNVFILLLIVAMMLFLIVPENAFADDEEETVDQFVTSRERVIKVGETIELEYEWEQNKDIVFDVQKQDWLSSNTDVAVIESETEILTEDGKLTGSRVSVSGEKAGTVTVSYNYEVYASYPKGSSLNNDSKKVEAKADIPYIITVVDEGSDSTFMVIDDIVNSGCFVINPGYTDAHNEEVFRWYRSENGIDWAQVERKRISGNQYNISKNGRRLNVVLDAKYMNAGDKRYYYKASVELPEGDVKETMAIQVGYYESLQNGSFEEPEVIDSSHIRQVSYDSPEAEGLIWKTTAPDHKIELLEKGSKHYVTPIKGTQAAEINSSFYGAMYQDLLTVPGSTMYWNLLHAKRGDGNPDVMAIVILSAGKAQEYNNYEKLSRLMDKIGVKNDSFEDGYYSADGVQIYLAKCSTAKKDGWKEYSGELKVPVGQYLTRFFFVSLASNNSGYGNIVDDINFSREVPQPDPGKGNLGVKKTITGLSEDVINNYSIDVTVSDDDVSTTDVTRTITVWTPAEGLENTFEGSTVFTELPLEKDGNPLTYKLTERTSGLADGKYVLMDSSVTSHDEIRLQDGDKVSAELKNEYESLKTGVAFKKIWKGEGSLEAAKSISIALTGSFGEKTVSYTGTVTAEGGTLVNAENPEDVIAVSVETEDSVWNISIKDLPKYASSDEEVASGKGEKYTWSVAEKQVNGVDFALKMGKLTASEEGVGRWAQTVKDEEGITTITNTLNRSSNTTPPTTPTEPTTPAEPVTPDEPGIDEPAIPDKPGGIDDPGKPGDADNQKSPGGQGSSDGLAAERDIPKTGDSSNLLLYVLLAAGSIAAITAMIRRIIAK